MVELEDAETDENEPPNDRIEEERKEATRVLSDGGDAEVEEGAAMQTANMFKGGFGERKLGNGKQGGRSVKRVQTSGSDRVVFGVNDVCFYCKSAGDAVASCPVLERKRAEKKGKAEEDVIGKDEMKVLFIRMKDDKDDDDRATEEAANVFMMNLMKEVEDYPTQAGFSEGVQF